MKNIKWLIPLAIVVLLLAIALPAMDFDASNRLQVLQSIRTQIVPTQTPIIQYVVATPAPTPKPTVDIRKRYDPWNRILDHPPVTVINGNEVAPYGNMQARYLPGSRHAGGEVQITVQCPVLLWHVTLRPSAMPHPICGLVVEAYIDGIRLDDHDSYLSKDNIWSYETFYLPNTRDQEHVLTADIYVYPNMIYQTHWKLVPGEETPIGPLELTTTVEDFAKLASEVTWQQGPIKVKTGIGQVVVPPELRPYLFSIYAVKPGQEATIANTFAMKVDDNFRFWSYDGFTPGTYEMAVSFEVPDTRQGGQSTYVHSPRTKVLWVK